MFTPITAFFAAAALLPGLASSATLSGLGTISVLNSSSFTTATPDMSIGCIDAAGRLVMDGCATFEFRDTYPNGIFTSDGNCSFTDSSQPANTDSRYGANSYAWSCWSHEAAVTDQLYTVVSSPRLPSSPPCAPFRSPLHSIPHPSAVSRLWHRNWPWAISRTDFRIPFCARATQTATLTSLVRHLGEVSSCRSGGLRGAAHSRESPRVIWRPCFCGNPSRPREAGSSDGPAPWGVLYETKCLRNKCRNDRNGSSELDVSPQMGGMPHGLPAWRVAMTGKGG